jgi:hypothetical protein
MKKSVTKSEIDEIHMAMDVLISAGCFSFIDKYIATLILPAWRINVDLLLTYAKTTLAYKNKLPSRKKFIEHCKVTHPTPNLWKGLD